MNQTERDDFAVGCRRIATEEWSAYHCSHVGVAAITHVVVKQHGTQCFEARVGVAIMGSTNTPDPQMDDDPFSDDYMENWCSGTGLTEVEALQALSRDIQEMSRMMV